MFGYVIGKPLGIVGVSWLVTRLSRGRLRAPVGWGAVIGGGAIAGIGFTVALLIATLAFQGDRLEEAKLGVLTAALTASVRRGWSSGPQRCYLAALRIRALLGTSETLVDLALPVDLERDHLRGPRDAPVTVVEYGDFECPYCGRAEPAVRELLADFGDVRYVWRHLPLSDVHPNAQRAAEAVEAAADQGAFWEMHDALLDHQDDLRPRDLFAYAEQLGLDVERFRDDLSASGGPRGSRRTSTPPTSVASPARRRSSSTGASTTAPTTSAHSQPQCVRQGLVPQSTSRIKLPTA